jgi:transposase
MRGGCPHGRAQHNQHGKQPPSRRRREFTPEFKRDAVELVRTCGRPIAEIARDLGIWDSTLGDWVRQAQIDDGQRAGLSSDERARLGELERENAWLRMERDLLSRKCA